MVVSTSGLTRDLGLFFLTLAALAALAAMAGQLPVRVSWQLEWHGRNARGETVFRLHWVPELGWRRRWSAHAGDPGELFRAFRREVPRARGNVDWRRVLAIVRRTSRRTLVRRAEVVVTVGTGSAFATGLAAGTAWTVLGWLQAYVYSNFRVATGPHGTYCLRFSVLPAWDRPTFGVSTRGIVLVPLGHIMLASWQLARAFKAKQWLQPPGVAAAPAGTKT